MRKRLVKYSRFTLLLMIFSTQMTAGQALAGQSPVDTPVPVEIVEESGRYRLLRGGRPYQVRGAGGAEAGGIGALAAHGGNALRTWTTGEDTSAGRRVLDEALRHDVTVALCIELRGERRGFDYDDEEAVARQLEYARGEVMKFKDHPALLMWIIGNELNHSFTNPRVFDAINGISRMIHEVDGNHPTTTALSGFSADVVAIAEDRAADLDMLSFQLYGGIDQLPQQMAEIGYTGPFMITEWGTNGHWEVEKTAWGAPIEMNSSEKARRYLQRYESVIAPDPQQIIGSYVFLWGQKQERTPTWYGVFLEDGSETEVVDVMHYIWNGEWPENRSPQIEGMVLDLKRADQNVILDAGKGYDARVDAIEPDTEDLVYRWLIMRESAATQEGGDREVVPDTVAGRIETLSDGKVRVTAPDEPGAYRLFVYVYDGNRHAGHANIPFQVVSKGQ